MNKKITFMRINETQRYASLGALFGFLFPIIGTLFRMLNSHLPITLSGFASAQTTDPILWVVDTAPLVLGLFAGYAGHTQDRLLIINEKLVAREQELQRNQLTLEQRVDDRTREIEHRNNLLKAVAEVGKGITSFRNLTELLQQTTFLIRDNFGFYHVGIFLLDDRKDYAVLTATNSDGGQRMLEKNHRLKVGETGIVGFVTEAVKARIALDVGQDAVFFNNPDLPDTRSEMALPLVVGGQVFGALDVQSTVPQAFTQDDIATLQILAEQLAIAIQNANLFSETEKALETSRSFYGNLSREAWGKVLRSQPPINFLATPPATVQVYSEVSDSSIAKAIETGDIIIGNDNLTIGIPIKVRGLAIGAIRLKKNEISEAWTQEEINLAIALSGQISGALESARLYKESQQLAARESLVSNISSRISAFSNVDSILRETVQELGQTIGNASVSIQLIDQFNSQKQTEGQEIGSGIPNANYRKQNLSGYTYLADGTITTELPASSLVFDKALASGETEITEHPSNGIPSALAFPIKFRDQVVGILHIQAAEENRKWTEDEIIMVQSISDRAAFTLENARLLEESLRRASREQSISQISARIGTGTQIDSILKIAIRELGSQISGAQIMVEMGIDDK